MVICALSCRFLFNLFGAHLENSHFIEVDEIRMAEGAGNNINTFIPIVGGLSKLLRNDQLNEVNLEYYCCTNLNRFVTNGYSTNGRDYKKCWMVVGRAPDAYKLIVESMEFNQSRAIWGKMKQDHNVEIDRNEAYNLGDLVIAIKSLINSNSSVKIVRKRTQQIQRYGVWRLHVDSQPGCSRLSGQVKNYCRKNAIWLGGSQKDKKIKPNTN